MIGFIGCFIGTMVGALPAIGPINGIALLLPIAYTMGLPAESTMILLAAIYCGAEYGGGFHRSCSMYQAMPVP